MFICPVCLKELKEEPRRYVCHDSHSFDRAKSGYVNLLQSQESSDKRHGDDKSMVNARCAFLEKGYYAPLRDAVCEALKRYIKTDAAIFDIGCGEGYYTEALTEKVSKNIFGIDISKEALRAADRRKSPAHFAVGSAFRLPFGDKTADAVTEIFAPAAFDSFYRVLKDDGVLLRAFPLQEHLWELKSAVYPEAYKNKPPERDEKHFVAVFSQELKYQITLDNKADIENLFMMTPYFYKTSKEDAARLLSLQSLTVGVHFGIEIYRKIKP